MDCQGEEGKGHPARVLCGMIRKDLIVERVCQHLEEVDLQVEQHLPLQVLAEDNKESLVDRYQGVILQMP